MIAVAQVMKLSDDTNMRVIRQLIINANKEAIGWRLDMHEHDIAATSACLGLSCNDLEKFLPHLIYNDYNILAHILREYELRQKPSN